MRFVFILLMTALLLSGTASALGLDSLVQLRTAALTEELSLSAEQAAKVQSVVSTCTGELLALASEKSDEPRKARDAYNSLESKAHDEVTALLDDKQKSQMDDLTHTILPEPRLLVLNEKLDLTSEQVTGIEKVLRTYRVQMPERESGGEREGGGPRERMQQMQDNLKKQDSEIEKLLTKEQKKIYDKLKKERQEQMPKFRDGDRGPGGGGRRPDGGFGRG